MAFHDTLQEATREESKRLLNHPFVQAAQHGDLSMESYLAFLAQAYHHVKHTAPIFMAAGARLPQSAGKERRALAEYIEEEIGHDEWILNDIRACGGDAEAVRHGQPNWGCELMVSFVYDTVNRHEPMGAFGMVHVLEGTSIQAATPAAEAIREGLGLGPEAVTYLSSHGSLDIEHYEFFIGLMNEVTDAAIQDAIIHSARMCFRLYTAMFDELPLSLRSAEAAVA